MTTPLWGPDFVPPEHSATTWEEWAEYLRGLDAVEQQWRSRPATPAPWAINPKECVGWLPYQMADFIRLLAESMPAIQGPKFLDVGCGPGTKMQAARALFGLNVAGLEIVPEMAQAAREAALRVAEVDARSWLGYGEADVIFMNRPIVPPERLERHVMRLMKPGAVLISVNGVTRPSQAGWDVVSEEIGPGPVKGIWARPEVKGSEPAPDPAADLLAGNGLRPYVTDIPLPEQAEKP